MVGSLYKMTVSLLKMVKNGEMETTVGKLKTSFKGVIVLEQVHLSAIIS